MAPAIRQLVHLEDHEDLSLLYPWNLLQFLIEEENEVFPIFAKDLYKEVELTRGHEEVADFGELSDLLGHGIHLARLDRHADHGRRIPSQKLRLRDTDDLQYSVIHKLLDPSAHRSFRDAQSVGDIGERHPPIVLKLGDDSPIGFV